MSAHSTRSSCANPLKGRSRRGTRTVRTFANFYLTVPGLIAALLGFVLLARRDFWRMPELFTTVAVFSFFFFYKIRIASDHFWMARRFLPVILPGALLFAAAAALSGIRKGWGRRAAAWNNRRCVPRPARCRSSRARAQPILPHVEYAGVIGDSRRWLADSAMTISSLVESRTRAPRRSCARAPARVHLREDVLVLNSAEARQAAVRGFP